jgi:hypothetical protein
MWEITKLEKLFYEKTKSSGSTLLDTTVYKTNYENVKEYCCKQIYPNIARAEPTITDHGEMHIQDVLQRAYEIVNMDRVSFTPLELYILCMSILVHDVGNLSGREEHTVKINDYFNHTIFNTIDKDHIKIVTLVASKHGGKNCDTIGSLLNAGILDGDRLDLCKIAAVLRFADELAEGKQRTSSILLSHQVISKESTIYHEYSSVLQRPIIDHDTIILEYNLYLRESNENSEEKQLNYKRNELAELIRFIFSRIQKLYNELMYCAHFCSCLDKLKKVKATLNFYLDDNSYSPIELCSGLNCLELSNQGILCRNTNKNAIDETVQQLIDVVIDKGGINE